MTTLPDLEAKIAAYLQHIVADFDVNGINLLRDAINQSQRYAQMQHDFEMMRCSVDVSVSLTSGVIFSPAFLHGTSNYVTIKKIRRAYIASPDQGIRPIGFTNQEYVSNDLALRWQGTEWSRGRAFPAPFDFVDTPTLVQSGQHVYLYPADQNVFGASPVSMMLDVYRYFPNYDEDDDNDFMLQFGDDFLFYDSLCRLNFYWKEFVNRQEGNVAPPNGERDAAWAALLAWDASLILSGDTALTLD